MTQCAAKRLPMSRDQLERFCIEAMCRCGMTDTDARLASEVRVTTDTFGVFTHGTKSLRGYVRRLSGGGTMDSRNQETFSKESRP